MAREKKGARRPIYFREWRKKKGLNQEQAAERASLSQSTITRLENRKIEYTETTLEALAHAYGCEPGDLFRSPDHPENEVAAYLMRLDGKKRSQAIKVLKAMSDDGEAA